MGNILRKLISGGDNRHSRFHTEDNIFIGWPSVLSEAPVAAAQKIRGKITGSRPLVPWWPLSAIEEVAKRLKPDMTSIEFGSGSSSIWISRRVGSLVCREHDEAWAEITRQRLVAEGVKNCQVQHRTGAEYYYLETGDRFDFAVVDGEYRWKCIENLADRMRRGGIIYFDNSDSDKDCKHYRDFGLTGMRHAQALVRELEQVRGVRVELFHGIIHGELFAGSGMLLTFP